MLHVLGVGKLGDALRGVGRFFGFELLFKCLCECATHARGTAVRGLSASACPNGLYDAALGGLSQLRGLVFTLYRGCGAGFCHRGRRHKLVAAVDRTKAQIIPAGLVLRHYRHVRDAGLHLFREKFLILGSRVNKRQVQVITVALDQVFVEE
ncbi:hypothetical protein GALL_522590 [mine drainage metagenome]|uniref:Uncharacterized protein n=1 Tax=mine drainage metagenome TaxID=410659 RepID=A0A1J5PEE3_9ZZZZ